MNMQINRDIKSINSLSDMPPATVPDSDIQAVSDLGELAFLAATYQDLVSKGKTDLAAKTLAEFQKIYSYYHITMGPDGKTVASISFDYNEGAGKSVVIDPKSDAFEILSHLPILSNPPTAADVGTFNSFWVSTTPIVWNSGASMTIWERILEYYVDTNFTMERNVGNNITNASVLLFYCSLANVPGAQVSGALDKFVLTVGYHDGALIDLGNIFALPAALIAHFSHDSTIGLDVIGAGLNITTKDSYYQMAGQTFNSLVGSLSLTEDDAWDWESRFFPYHPIQVPSEKIVHALSENTRYKEKGREKQSFKPRVNEKLKYAKESL